MKTKWIFIVIIGLFIISFTPQTAKACEIEFEVIKGKKEAYQVGDTLVVLVEVVLTHRACPIKMQKTKFTMKGLKVIKSTPWKQTAANDWERKLMIVVKETDGDKLNLSAVRECEKDGGFGSMILKMSK